MDFAEDENLTAGAQDNPPDGFTARAGEDDTEINMPVDTLVPECGHYVPESILQYYDTKNSGRSCYEKSNIGSRTVLITGIAAAVAALVIMLCLFCGKVLGNG